MTSSKLQTVCFYQKYLKNYKLLNTMTPNKMLKKEKKPFHFESKHVKFKNHI